MGTTLDAKGTWLTWIGRGLALSMLIVTAGAAYWIGVRMRPGDTRGQDLVVAEQYLDLGQVWEDSTFPWTLPVENRTDHDIEIQKVTASCNCLLVDVQPVVIPAGQTVPVQLILDLTKRVPEPAGSKGYNYEVRVAPQFKGSVLGQREWILRGRVEKALAVDPAIVDFDDPLIRGRPFPKRTVSVTCGPRAKELIAECAPRFGAVKLTALQDKPGRFELTVSPAKDLPAGSFQFVVTLRGQTQEGKRFSVAVAVTGRVREEFYFLPERVVFGARPLGETAEEIVTLQSPHGTKIKILGFEGLSDSITIGSAPGNGSRTLVFRVSQKIMRLGDQTTRVRCRIQKEGAGQPEDAVLLIDYHGIKKP